MVEFLVAVAILAAAVAGAVWMHKRSVRAVCRMTDECLIMHMDEAEDWGDGDTVYRNEYNRRMLLKSLDDRAGVDNLPAAALPGIVGNAEEHEAEAVQC